MNGKSSEKKGNMTNNRLKIKNKKNSETKVNIRTAVFCELCHYAENDTFINISLDSTIKKLNLSGHDRDFFTALVYGVTERQITLDYFLSNLSSIPLENLDLTVLTALRIGAYQILFMDRIPDSAACNESVKLIKKRTASAAPFVNAVLRSLIRKKDTILLPDKTKIPEKYLSVRYSLPENLIVMWEKMYGKETTEKILSGIDTPPALTLRVNTLKATRDELLYYLTENNIDAVPSPESKFGIRLLRSVPVSSLDCLKKGLCIVQDDASSLSVEVLEPRPEDTVIDVCSAPGGKSLSAAMLMENKGKILSFDLYENKLKLINDSSERLGINIIKTECSDSSEYKEELQETADRIICDVPCSGLGVIAKKPDIRCRAFERVRDNYESGLTALQYKILCSAARYLKRNGRLVYSTCTLNKHENEDIVNRFVSEHSEFKIVSVRTFFPDGTLDTHFRTDGFFYALITRT